MLARVRKSMEEKDQGFTLIELLVVMIIIGILAAIAIPVFLNQQGKARLTAAKADASTIAKEFATYYVDGSASTSAANPTTGTTNVWTFTSTDTTPYTTTGTLSGKDSIISSSGASSTSYCVMISTNNSNDKQVVNVNAKGLTLVAFTSTPPAACTA